MINTVGCCSEPRFPTKNPTKTLQQSGVWESYGILKHRVLRDSLSDPIAYYNGDESKTIRYDSFFIASRQIVAGKVADTIVYRRVQGEK
jgi:hypothetical protein